MHIRSVSYLREDHLQSFRTLSNLVLRLLWLQMNASLTGNCASDADGDLYFCIADKLHIQTNATFLIGILSTLSVVGFLLGYEHNRWHQYILEIPCKDNA